MIIEGYPADQSLLQRCIDYKSLNDGSTSLHVATIWGRIDVAKLIISHGKVIY